MSTSALNVNPFGSIRFLPLLCGMALGMAILGAVSCGGGGSNTKDGQPNNAVGNAGANANSAFNGTIRNDGTSAGHTAGNANNAFAEMGGNDPFSNPNTNRNTGGSSSGNNSGGNVQQPGPREIPKPSRSLTPDEVQQYWFRDKNDPRYPRENYLLGVGTAEYAGESSFGQSDAKAREDLQAYFLTEVRGALSSYANQVVQARPNAPVAVQESLNVTSVTETLVRGSMEGVQIMDRSISKDNKACFSLAVLDRRMAADNLKLEIDKLKTEMLAKLAAARNYREQSKFLSAATNFAPCLRLYQQIIALIKQYNLVKPASYPAIDPGVDPKELINGLLEMAQKMTFAFKLEVELTDPDGTLRPGTSSAIESSLITFMNESKMLVSIVRATPKFMDAEVDSLRRMSTDEIRGLLGSSVNYIVIGKFSSAHIGMLRDNHQYRAMYDLEVIELQSGSTWKLADQQGRAQGIDRVPKVANEKAFFQSSKLLAAEIIKKFSVE